MTKLEQLYNSIQNLKELGVQLPDKLIEETSRIEEEIIREEIIPKVKEAINPVITQIQRELVLVVEYIPDEPLAVRITRKRSFSAPEEIEVINHNPKPFTPKKGYSVPLHSKSEKTVLSVRFPDGKVVSERFAYETLVKCISIIGYEKIQPLNMSRAGVPLISNKKDDYYRQTELKPGVLVMTHSSTQDKKQQLDEISRRLNLNLIVDIV
ncbi:hypothetical protein [Flaviaesturariibacter amylovorans]|uniref:Uncharacterized protein n=1 Tax=Flaviaesturariibacter amylovorans TaxID=1084520 RepID=A0ABP8HJH8_9BACT